MFVKSSTVEQPAVTPLPRGRATGPAGSGSGPGDWKRAGSSGGAAGRKGRRRSSTSIEKDQGRVQSTEHTGTQQYTDW